MTAREELHAPFRPVRARRVALAAAVSQAVVLVALAVVLPYDGPGAFQWYDRLGIVLVAAALAWGLSRYVLISAVPGEDGLMVRNLFVRRFLEWPEVVAVRFGEGDPWVSLDLDDGETMAVMAVQRADGPVARQEARRLSTLVALHSRTPRDD